MVMPVGSVEDGKLARTRIISWSWSSNVLLSNQVGVKPDRRRISVVSGIVGDGGLHANRVGC